jgi:hypothetical protein
MCNGVKGGSVCHKEIFLYDKLREPGKKLCTPFHLYTSEDLKWDALKGVILNRY